MKSQDGFTLIEGLLIVLVAVIIGVGGYYVWSQQKSGTIKEETINSSHEAEQNIQEEADEIQTTDKISKVDWISYENSELGFSFSYPKKYGEVIEYSSYGSENQNALRYTFHFENLCTRCESNNPFAVGMASEGIVEIGATTSNFGGIGTGRPYASSYGYQGEGNFDAVNAIGLLETFNDEMHNKTRTSIEFNLTKSDKATGIMFMTHDEPGETSNADNLKSIAETFRLL